MRLQRALELAYSLEMNLKIECFWDSGWVLVWGDDENGWNKCITRSYDLKFITKTIKDVCKTYMRKKAALEDYRRQLDEK